VEIIKPLLDKFISGEGSVSPNSLSVRGEEIKPFKCEYCDKTSYSSPGLKSHVTKMHPESKLNIVKKKQPEGQEKEIHKEAKKVVNLILKEIIEISDDDESIDDITLEEKNDLETDDAGKKYSNECDICGFVATATRRYVAIRMLSKHKEACFRFTKCVECDFSAKDSEGMKRHMRDQHEVMSSSTSPPLKRKKKTDDVNLIESETMDVEESFINLSIELENMEIETPKEEEDDLFSHRSKLMDEKIIEKARKIDEKESLLRNKKKEVDEKKKRLEDQKTENVKIISKKQKQKQKDEKKKKLKARTKAVSSGKTKFPVLNIKDIPENCKHLVNIDDVLYVVPGDGCCGPNCGAAFLFSDEVY
jgi:hypothetical protein